MCIVCSYRHFKFYWRYNIIMEKKSDCKKGLVVFPFLIEEPKSTNHDVNNLSFVNGLTSKWPEKRSRLMQGAFPPSRSVLHERERSMKGFHGKGYKETNHKSLTCPNIVDMSNIIFYHDQVKQSKPRRIINGFFPNKIRSTQGSFMNEGTGCQNPHRNRNSQVKTRSPISLYWPLYL